MDQIIAAFVAGLFGLAAVWLKHHLQERSRRQTRSTTTATSSAADMLQMPFWQEVTQRSPRWLFDVVLWLWATVIVLLSIPVLVSDLGAAWGWKIAWPDTLADALARQIVPPLKAAIRTIGLPDQRWIFISTTILFYCAVLLGAWLAQCVWGIAATLIHRWARDR